MRQLHVASAAAPDVTHPESSTMRSLPKMALMDLVALCSKPCRRALSLAGCKGRNEAVIYCSWMWKPAQPASCAWQWPALSSRSLREEALLYFVHTKALSTNDIQEHAGFAMMVHPHTLLPAACWTRWIRRGSGVCSYIHTHTDVPVSLAHHTLIPKPRCLFLCSWRSATSNTP